VSDGFDHQVPRLAGNGGVPRNSLRVCAWTGQLHGRG
jgi:hypothetical protein